MFQISSTPTSQISQFSLRVESTVAPPTFSFHLTYITGKRAELWKELIKREILDVYGNVTAKFAALPLPPLEENEIKQIEEHLFQPITIRLTDGRSVDISLAFLLHKFAIEMPFKTLFKVDEINLIGGFVTYLLFSCSNYIERVFEALGIQDLYDPSLLPSNAAPPPDIDVRMRIRKQEVSGYTSSGLYIPPSTHLSHNEMEIARNYIIQTIAAHFLSSNSKPEETLSVINEIIKSSFKTLETVSNNLNTFQVLSFKESPFDWVFYDHLFRLSVFSTEMYLPLAPILKLQPLSDCRPSSFQGSPLSAIFHNLLKFNTAEFPEKIDERGLLRLITNRMRGFISMQKRERPSEKRLEQKLFETFVSKCSQEGGGLALSMQNKITKWISKHHPNDPMGTLFFVLNAVQILINPKNEKYGIDETDIANIITLHCTNLKFDEEEVEGRIAASIVRLLFVYKVPPIYISSLLQCVAFLIENSISLPPKKIEVTLGSQDFVEPVLKLEMAGYTLQLPCKMCEALRHLNSLVRLFVKEGQEIEIEMNKLFLLFCKPNDLSSPIKKEKLSSLAIDYDSYSKIIFQFLEQQTSIFLKYFGIIYLSSLEGNESLRRRYCQLNLIDILQYNQEEESIYYQLTGFIGASTLPPLKANNFEEAWITHLFNEEPDSCEMLYSVWERYVIRGGRLAFSLDLIKLITNNMPDHALHLFNYLSKAGQLGQLSDADAVQFIFSCVRIIKSLTRLLFVHKCFLDTLAKFLENFFVNPQVSYIVKTHYSEDLLWLIEWYNNRNLLKADSKILAFALQLDLPLAKQMAFELQLANLVAKRDFENAKELLKKDITEQRILSEEACYPWVVQVFLYEVVQGVGQDLDLVLSSYFIDCFAKSQKVDPQSHRIAFFLIDHSAISFVQKLQLAYALAVVKPELSVYLLTLVRFCFDLEPKHPDFYSMMFFFAEHSLRLNQIDPQVLKAFFHKSFANLIIFNQQNPCEQKWAQVLDKIIRLYTKELEDMPVTLWDSIFGIINTTEPKRCFPLFGLLEKSLDLKNKPELYQRLFGTTAFSCYTTKDPQIIRYITDPDKLASIFSSVASPHAAFIAHAYLLLAGCEFEKKDSTLIPHVKRIFTKGDEYYHLFKDSTGFSITFSQYHVYIKSFFDFSYLQMLLTSSRKVVVNEGKTWLLKKLKNTSEYPESYWQKFLGKVMALLAEKKLIHELDEVLVCFETYTTIQAIKEDMVISFLISQFSDKKPRRIRGAMNLWFAWSANMHDPSDFWKLGFLLIDAAIEYNYPFLNSDSRAHFTHYIDQLMDSASLSPNSFNLLKKLATLLMGKAKAKPQQAQLILNETTKVLKKMRSNQEYVEKKGTEIEGLLANYKEILLTSHKSK